MSVESRPNKLVKGLVLDTFHTDVDNTVATYALNAQLEDQEGNHFHYGSEVGTTYIKEIPTGHVVVGHINMERNETVLFTTDGTNSTIGILSRNDNMAYHYEIKVDDTNQTKKLGFKKEGYVRGVYRLLNGCDKVIYFVDGVNKDRRVNINQLDSYKIADTQSVASGIIFDDSLRATIFALSSASGNIQLIRLMSASPEATANVLATLTSGAELTKLLTASANGIGTALANLMRTANIISSVEASGTTTSNVDIVRLLQGNISAIGSVNAILESTQQGVVEIDVTLSGVASSTAILLRAALLESSLTTEASTIVEAILTRVINAQSQATANTSATAQITVPINATANATATTAADAILSYAVNATANAMAETSATAQLSQVINASLNATATSSVEALIGLVLISTTTANGSISTANLFINRLLTSSVTAQGTTTAEALIAKLLQSSVTGQANTTSNAVVSKLASSSVTAEANITANSLVSKLLASTVSGLGSVTANLQLADLLSLTVSGTATIEALLEATGIILGDPYIDNVSLLLQGDDRPAGVTQNNTFKDSSTNNFTIIRNGNVTQGTFSPFDKSITNSGGSAYFDGTGDYLTLPDSDAWHFGGGLFCIEFWARKTVASGLYSITAQINSGFTGHQFRLVSTGIIFNSFNNSPTPVDITATYTPDTNWHHYAVSSDGTTLRLFYDGIVVASRASTVIGNSSGNLYIGIDWDQSSAAFNGYISNLRIVKGTAVYTANFQPSTIPLTAITNTSLLLNFTNAAIFDGVKLNNVETVGTASITTVSNLIKFGNGAIAINDSSSSSDYITVPSNTIHNLGSSDFTIEFWLYVIFNPTTSAGLITRASHSGNTGYTIMYYPTGYVALLIGTNLIVQSAISSISTSTWTHIAFVRSGTSGRFFINGTQSGSTGTVNNFTDASTPLAIGALNTATGWNANLTLTGVMDDIRITKGIARYNTTFTTPIKLSSLIPNYLINRSLRFNPSRSTYLSRTPTVAGNRTTWTWSGWVKMSEVSSNSNSIFSANSGAAIDGGISITSSSINVGFNGNSFNKNTSIVLRDLAAWYHIVVVLNTSSSIADQRIRVYVNGIEQTNYTVANSGLPGQGYVPLYLNNATIHNIGKLAGYNQDYFNGYLAEVNFIDGQTLTPTSFGELDLNLGTWIPKLYTGTYGTNGFRLKFSDLTQLGEDFSGNLNNWTPSGFSVTPGANYDLMNDVPINADETIGNYATLNPISNPNNPLYTVSNGNLTFSCPASSGSAGRMSIITTIPLDTGKYYWEIIPTDTNASFGILSFRNQGIDVNAANPGNGYYIAVFSASQNSTISGPIYSGTTFTYVANDIIGLRYDGTLNTLSFYKNNTFIGAYSNIPSTEMWFAGTGVSTGGAATNYSINFGQRPFAYSIPTGFKTLNTSNLPTPTIGATTATQANKFMDVSLYTGTGAAQSVFNSGFKPDLVWIKNRTGTAASHAIYDINRGVTKQLSSDSANAETTQATGLTSFDTTGFTIGALGQINTSGNNYIAWQWRASGTTVANTVGTIASTVSVNTTAGFSVIRYTVGSGAGSGGTIGHGLGIAPRFIINRVFNKSDSWKVYHASLPATNAIYLQGTNASTTDGVWGNTVPTIDRFTIGNGYLSNGDNVVAYAWAEIDGFSKFNSYVGNGNPDGTFVYTGFRPKFILIKGTGAGTNWAMFNSIVNTSNPVINELLANSSVIENTTGTDLDFLSNGFKLRSTNLDINTSAATYIYAAFAEFPLKYANAALTERVRETVTVNYLVLAAGGGGGGYWGGGGGAGGYFESTANFTKNITHLLTVGQPGAFATNGNNSVFSNITSIGGGRGGVGGGQSSQRLALTGGSGGGGGSSNLGGNSLSGANGTSPQGFAGGNSAGASGTYASAGGGGASTNGVTPATTTSSGGNGGDGIESNITGTLVKRGGGGGGAAASTVGRGTNTFGGGSGTTQSLTTGNVVTAGSNGTQFTGGGGGGGGPTSNDSGYLGGSGVVIIKIPDANTATFSVGVSGTTPVISGGFKIYTITAAGVSDTVTFS